jgi:hypothetical protein
VSRHRLKEEKTNMEPIGRSAPTLRPTPPPRHRPRRRSHCRSHCRSRCRSRRRPLQHLRLAACLALALLALTSCAAVSLREAQDAFNAAVAAESAQREAGMVGDGGLSTHVSALGDYRAALFAIDQQLGSGTEELREQQLLGTAYMLKALCLWRIADLADLAEQPNATDGHTDALDALRTTIQAEYDAQRIVLGTRDRVLLAALPGLRDHDRGLRATALEGPGSAAAWFGSAVATLEDALLTVDPPKGHPVRIYVWLAQLSSLRAWQAAAFRLGSPIEAAAYVGERITPKAKSKIELLESLAKDEPGMQARIKAFKLSMGL